MRQTPPDLLFITIDCLRPDILGCYGGAANTPGIDRLAAGGIRYTQAFSHAHFTRPAFASIFSAVYPWEAREQRGFQPQQNLVDQLQAAGYKTLGVNSNTWLSRSFGYGSGYTEYKDLAASQPVAYSLPARAFNHLLGAAGGGYLRPPYPSCEVVTRAAADLLQNVRNSGDAPFFLWLHYMDAHWPYNLARPRLFLPWNPESHLYNSRFARRSRNQPDMVSPEEKQALWSIYRLAVERIDRQVSLLVEHVSEKTAIILTSDHGEAFGEHGSFYHEPNLYGENVRVPLLMRAPGVSGGRIENELVRHIDLVPTLLSLAGVRQPDPLPGVDLFPSARGEQRLPELPAISWMDDPVRKQQRFSIRFQGWAALAVFQRENLELQHAELYDTSADQYERVDLAREYPERLGALLNFLRDQLSGLNPQEPGLADGDPEILDPEIRERLKALGYLE